jgi:GNAT superfamily N-acetyltransferase
MPIIYRPALVADLERANELVVGSMNELTERHGFGPIATVGRPNFSTFSLKDDPDGLWVAESAGQILGFAFSWVCGDLWFLAQLFVAPDQQGRGIGQTLLQRTFEHAQKTKAANRALVTFTFNSVSQGLYIRHGLFPRLPIYNFSVEREVMMGCLQRTASLHCTSIENTPSHFDRLAEIDARAFGVPREKHHQYLMDDRATSGVLLHAGDDCVGYAYIADGHIGPLAVTQRTAMTAAFQTALTLAAESGAPRVSAFLPGTSAAALRIAVDLGMRITLPMVLMSTHDFADWTLYLPRNPGFL